MNLLQLIISSKNMTLSLKISMVIVSGMYQSNLTHFTSKMKMPWKNIMWHMAISHEFKAQPVQNVGDTYQSAIAMPYFKIHVYHLQMFTIYKKV